MSDDVALFFYGGALWVSFFGMVAFPYRHPVTRRAKIAGAVIFVALLIDSATRMHHA